MQPINAVPIEVLAAQKKAADRLRSEFMFGIHDGLFTIPEVICAAVEPANRPLLKSRLYQLLLAVREISEPKARRIVENTLSLSASKATPTAKSLRINYQKANLAWLLDERSNGRRLACLFDAMVKEGVGTEKRAEPWPGFPMSAPPAEATRGTTMAGYSDHPAPASAGGGA